MEVAANVIKISRPPGSLASASNFLKKGSDWDDNLLIVQGEFHTAEWKAKRLKALRENGDIMEKSAFLNREDRLLHDIRLVGRPETATSGTDVDLGDVDVDKAAATPPKVAKKVRR